MNLIDNINRKLNKAKKVINNASDKDAKVTDTTDKNIYINEEVKKSIDTLNSRLDSINVSGDDDKLIENIQSGIEIYAGEYRWFGAYHGRNGTCDFNIAQMALTSATLYADRIKSTLNGRVSSLSYHIGQMEKSNTLLGKKMEQMDAHLSEIIGSWHDNHKKFNLFLGVSYIIVGILMVLADIIVSINLVAFFGIGADHKPGAAFLEKFLDLDLLFFSLGVAFCTVFVKILYDEYINTETGQVQILFNSLIKKEGVRKYKLNAELIGKLIVKLLILAGLLYMLYYMAEYRTYFTLSQSSWFDDIQKDSQPMIDIPSVLIKCYLGITVIVPIISGISLSMGMKITGNIRAMKDARKNKEEADNNFNKNVEELKKIKDRYERLKKYQEEWLETPDKIKLVSNYFIRQYYQEFKVNYKRVWGNDFYMIIEEYRNTYINTLFIEKN